MGGIIEDGNPITKLTLTILSAFSELERSFISRRTKSALAQFKKDGVVLGHPAGSIRMAVGAMGTKNIALV